MVFALTTNLDSGHRFAKICDTSLTFNSLQSLLIIFEDWTLDLAATETEIPTGYQWSVGTNSLKYDMKRKTSTTHQVVIAPWLARRLATGKVPGSNPGEGENLLISD